MVDIRRRGVLKGLLAAGSWPGTQPAAAAGRGIIDVHVYLSRWPTRRMRGDETSELVEILAQGGVAEAWAGSFDALLFKDIGAVNARLAEAWGEAARTATEYLRRGRDVAFVTLGDPTFYSTYFLLLDELTRLLPEVTVVTVPGVTSVSACAARLNLPLVQGDERLAVVSGARDPEALRRVLVDFDCTVVLKVGRHLPRVREMLRHLGLAERAVLAARCGLPGERLGSPTGVEEADYLSLLVVKK